MKIWINGEPRDAACATNIAELIAILELPAATLLVEHNGFALRRDEWGSCALREGDRVEVMRIAAGG